MIYCATLNYTEATTTVTMETNSDADHYAACSAEAQASYCLNGGTCTYIVALEQNSCECPANWKGSRCEYYNFGAVGNTEDNNNVAYLVLGCTFAFIFFLCVAVAALYIRSRRKNLRKLTEEGEAGEDEALTDVTVRRDKNQNTESKPGHTFQVSKIPYNSGHVSEEEDKSRLMGQTLDSSMNSTLTSSGSIYRKESSV